MSLELQIWAVTLGLVCAGGGGGGRFRVWGLGFKV